jgi:hypothetical protein
MDMKKIINITENCGYDAPGAPNTIPTQPPVSMNMNLTATGVDQIKELIKLMNDQGVPAAAPAAAGPTIELPPKEEEPGDDLSNIMKLAGAPEKEEFSNEPDEKYGDLDDVIRPGNDLHKEKRMFRKANGGDNAMAAESIRAQLDRRYREIKEGKV